MRKGVEGLMGPLWGVLVIAGIVLGGLHPLECHGQDVMTIRECNVIDPPDFPERYPQNNGDGLATPGEWVGLRLVVDLPQGLPTNPWVRVHFDESLMGLPGQSDSRRVRPASIEGTTGAYSVDLSDVNSRRVVRRRADSSRVRVEITDGLSTLGSSEWDLPIIGDDRTPPVVINMWRRPEGIVRPYDRLLFSVSLMEASRVVSARGRILRLPEGVEAAAIDLELSAQTSSALETDSHGGEWLFTGEWVVAQEGEFVLEVTGVDDLGNEASTVAYWPDKECRFTTAEFTKRSRILVYDRRPWSGTLEGVAEILGGLRVPFDHWNTGLRGETMDLWLDYSGNDELVVAPLPFVSEYAYPSSGMGDVLAGAWVADW